MTTLPPHARVRIGAVAIALGIWVAIGLVLVHVPREFVNSASAADSAITRPTALGTSQVSLPWHAFTGGGTTSATSATRRVAASSGQTAIGTSSGPAHQAGAGYWYGAGGCDCRGIADQDGDGFPTATDLQHEIDIVFFGAPDIWDPLCPYSRSDLNCDIFADASDLAYLIDLVFFGGSFPCAPCE
jgi:hypothetical protein